MRRATLELTITTPCFLSGSDQTKPDWRAASIRGQLRWWFRAIAGGMFGKDLATTKRAEETVFGSTEQKSSLAVRVLTSPGYWKAGLKWPLDMPSMKLAAADLAKAWGAQGDQGTIQRLQLTKGDGDEFPTDPLQYLAYGCVEYRSKRDHPDNWGLFLERPCFAPEETARIQLDWLFRAKSTEEAEAERIFTRALSAWMLLGGLGSKARNGFGSLRVTDTEGNFPSSRESLRPIADRGTLEAHILALVEAAHASEATTAPASWAHLGPNASIYLGAVAHDSWYGALALAGGWIMAYRRRYGYPGDSRQRNGSSIANRDYTWAKPRAKNPRGGLPNRAGFGLPLPFGKEGETATWWQRGNRGPVDQRRASPLHLHVAHVAEGFIPVFTHMPSQFLPNGAELAYTDYTSPTAPAQAAQLGIIDDFLSDLASKNLVQEVTP